MVSMLIRNVDDKALKRLREQARRNGRSLQAEVKILLEQAAREYEMSEILNKIDGFRSRVRGRKISNSVELIREDRDQ